MENNGIPGKEMEISAYVCFYRVLHLSGVYHWLLDRLCKFMVSSKQLKPISRILFFTLVPDVERWHV